MKTINPSTGPIPRAEIVNASEEEAEAAIHHLLKAIDAARNSNQAGENAVVKAAIAIGWGK